ncbi:hypothetical protein C8R45DRAFT_921933 [Mycena sanguinolenta]|nr:hypothetical protein C8R45DRAFT_921933 [Mycena sanguinolenta]
MFNAAWAQIRASGEDLTRVQSPGFTPGKEVRQHEYIFGGNIVKCTMIDTVGSPRKSKKIGSIQNGTESSLGLEVSFERIPIALILNDDQFSMTNIDPKEIAISELRSAPFGSRAMETRSTRVRLSRCGFVSIWGGWVNLVFIVGRNTAHHDHSADNLLPINVTRKILDAVVVGGHATLSRLAEAGALGPDSGYTVLLEPNPPSASLGREADTVQGERAATEIRADLDREPVHHLRGCDLRDHVARGRDLPDGDP